MDLTNLQNCVDKINQKFIIRLLNLIRDSGGPMVCGGKLTGVVSFGSPTCSRNGLNVHVRVSEYKGNLVCAILIYCWTNNLSFNFQIGYRVK